MSQVPQTRAEPDEAALTKEVPCAYCGGNVVGTAFLVCAACDVPVHRDCWTSGGRCPVYACGSINVLDPAVALYRRPQKHSFSVAEVDPKAEAHDQTPSPALKPETGPMSPPSEGTGSMSWPSTLFKMLTCDHRVSAVSIDVHVGDSLLRGIKRLFGRKTTVEEPVVARLRSRASSPNEEAVLVERELANLRLSRWVRRMGIVAGVLLMPVPLTLVSDMLALPILLGLVVWATWPGWPDRSIHGQERILRRRLDELHCQLAPPLDSEGPLIADR